MNIKQLPARHRGKGQRKVVGIVLHDTYGTGTHRDTQYLANPGDGRVVSCDFTVEKDGTIYQLNPELDNSWTYHAGRATQFKGLRNAGVTKGTIGIEICQAQKKAEYPEAQIKAVGELCRYLTGRFGLTANDITTHKAIITDGSRTDPRDFPFDKFWSYYGGAPSTNTIGGVSSNYAVYGIGLLFLFLLLDD